MIIEVESKDKDGNILFKGKLNKVEVEMMLNVGINYTLSCGIVPMFTGDDDEKPDLSKYAPTTLNRQ